MQLLRFLCFGSLLVKLVKAHIRRGSRWARWCLAEWFDQLRRWSNQQKGPHSSTAFTSTWKSFRLLNCKNTSQMEMNQRCIRNLRKIAFKHPKSWATYNWSRFPPDWRSSFGRCSSTDLHKDSRSELPRGQRLCIPAMRCNRKMIKLNHALKKQHLVQWLNCIEVLLVHFEILRKCKKQCRFSLLGSMKHGPITSRVQKMWHRHGMEATTSQRRLNISTARSLGTGSQIVLDVTLRAHRSSGLPKWNGLKGVQH